ncbi:hypothetical protein LCGC14_0735810 [marine sediment metagenome]|uniref:Disease resistance R13L4/SHOC-2-like LRR domain-containing protein n=1 Tax=marine sediment metagenome TaxID=412755 RepID=A0A0F9QCC5_9ZZZZ
MEYKINKHLLLKLENKKTNIYVDGQLFKQCHFLLLNISVHELANIERGRSIDEISETLNKSMERNNDNISSKYNITPEQEFQAHCSNLQAWVENGYDTRLLHRNLAFPLLKRLADIGDSLAKNEFKNQVAQRFSSGSASVIRFLIEGKYLDKFTDEELVTLFNSTDFFNCDDDLINNLTKGYITPLLDFIEPGSSILLSINKLNLGRMNKVPRSINELLNLKELTITNIGIPQDLKVPLSLHKLTLDNNSLTRFPAFVEELCFLKDLIISSNNLTRIPDSIGNLDSLEALFLPQNSLVSIPKSLGNLRSLEYLILNNNKLQSIPVLIGTLKFLKSLSFSNNRLANLPKTIGDLHSLFYLDLGTNKLTSLPESIGNLHSLEALFLADNMLTSIPDSIGNLRSLKRLKLTNNRLTSIPDSIRKLKFLQELYLSNNRLTNIPDSIRKLKSLQELYLSNNRLSNIQEFIENMKFLNPKLKIYL